MRQDFELGNAGAAAIIFDPSGLVLIVKENYGKHRWSLPGGMIEPGETPEDAVLREAWEETGVTAKIHHTVGSYQMEDGFTGFVFVCEIVEGVPTVPTTGEIADIQWAHPDALPTLRSNMMHYSVPDAVLGLRDVERVALPIVS
jgi:8-oxo-dGTP diphosphatase